MAQDLKKMTKAALESLGRQFGIELDRRLTKDKLIKQVKKAQKDAEKSEPEVVEEVAVTRATNQPEWKEYFTDAREGAALNLLNTTQQTNLGYTADDVNLNADNVFEGITPLAPFADISRSTNSITASGAASPYLKPAFNTLEYPPFLFWYRGASVSKSFITAEFCFKRDIANLLE